jgi:hypothetical protein
VVVSYRSLVVGSGLVWVGVEFIWLLAFGSLGGGIAAPYMGIRPGSEIHRWPQEPGHVSIHSGRPSTSALGLERRDRTDGHRVGGLRAARQGEGDDRTSE